MDGFLKVSHRIKETIFNVLGWVSSALMLILTIFALLEIVRRYIFSVVFEWGQDAIIVGMVSAVAFYFSVTQVRRGHLVMSAIVELLHSKGYYRTVGALKIAVSAIISAFCGSVGITGWATLSYAWERDLTSYSLIIPLWPFYLILMISFGLVSLVAFLQTIEDIIDFVRGDHLEDELDMTTDV
jgi:TRAP-type C4-dicarboxylate transport system permease small subunit